MNSFERLFDVLHYQNAHFPQAKCISYKYSDSTDWTNYSTQQCVEIVDQYSLAFLALGVQKGDKISIISPNRPEWNFCDNGMMQAGAINVPIYPTSSESDYAYIFNNAEIKYVFVSDADLYARVSHILPECPSVKGIYSFDAVENCTNITEFLSHANEKFRAELDKRKASILPEELATIIYTSGTTGFPKGVMLSHNNIVSNIKGVQSSLPLVKGQIALSFLPLCHIFERTVTYYYFSIGVSVFYAENMDKIRDNLLEVKPHFFSTVPRLLEKVYDRFIEAGNALTGPKKALYFWALRIANNYQEDQGFSFKFWIADKLVYSKWRERLGGNLIGIVTGAAALQERLARVFNAAGIKVREGYGQTETSPVVTFNRFEAGNFKFGTVGMLIPNVEIKFSEQNEILVKGPNVMMGYYNQPEITKQTIVDGWLRTGDVGTMVDGKYLKITDRIKELFKTSGGKYVAPQVIENKLKESRYIEQVIVVGENEKFVSALIVPNFLVLRDWCNQAKITFKSNADIAKHPAVVELVQKEIDRINVNFGHVEQVKKFELMQEEWTIDNGELTPTMKVKRKFILQKYAENIKTFYN